MKKTTTKSNRNLVVSLDIGTSKVVTLVAEIGPDGLLTVIGRGSHPSKGLKRGVVVDIDATTEAIARAVEEAELMADCEIRTTFTGIAGSHIRSLNSHGIVAIKDKEVTHLDVDRVIEAAKAVAIPADQQIIHVLPQEFVIDNQDGIRQPIGMSGVRLEAKVHMVTGAVNAATNIIKSVNQCGLDVGDVILEQLASSHAVLGDDEKDLGVCLVDIGGGTTDIAIFTGGAIRHTSVIPVAGDQVTNDIAVALRTPTQSAELIKRQYATVYNGPGEAEQFFEVKDVSGKPVRQVSSRVLADVVQARYEELFSLIKSELRRSGFEDLVVAGLVLTGGASKVPGVIELAEKIIGIPVRLGLPKVLDGMPEETNCPSYSTSVGLLMHAYQQELNDPKLRQGETTMHSVWERMKSWFEVNF